MSDQMTSGSVDDAFVGLAPVKTIQPNKQLAAAYKEAYETWEGILRHQLSVRQ
jgi:hypothetical protein